MAQQEHVGRINVNRTVISMKSPGRPVKFGDFFSVIIEAHDSYGRHSSTGGDFFCANIRSRQANAAGKITDFNNGTYEVIFFAAWPGVVSIEINLVHPSETIDFIERELWPMEGRVVWTGNFKKKKAQCKDIMQN